MGHKHSKPPKAPPTISSPLPSSPTILCSIFISPSTLTFPFTNRRPPELRIHLSNPTPSPITFRPTYTPLDVPFCFSSPCHAGYWTITDITNPSAPISVPIHLTTKPKTSSPTNQYPNKPSEDPPELQATEFITVPPQSQQSQKTRRSSINIPTLTLTFTISLPHPKLQPHHTYHFRMRDFTIKRGLWGYGHHDSVFEFLRRGESYIDSKESRELNVKVVKPGGAVLRM